jgi:SpoIID/LytB domain protein
VAAAVVLAIVAVAAVVAGPAPVAEAAYPTERVEISGRGWGHGRGMGQYGALGYAADHGWTHSRILDHFYGGTAAGHQPDSVISVHLTRLDDKPLIVQSGSPFTLGGVAVPAGTAAMVHRRSDGRWQVDRGPGCAGPWTTVVNDIPSTARPEAITSYGGDDLTRMLRVCDGTAVPYRGALMIRHDGGRTRVGNIITMERYLRGVVPKESPPSWATYGDGRGFEALKAQSVAARSYAWAENRTPFKTCDTTSCQVYGGASGEDPRTTLAVGATNGEVRRFPNGGIARTEFSSSTGGYSAGGQFPPVPDLGDAVAANPNRAWSVSPTARDVGAAFGVGVLDDIVVTRRNGLGADGGRVLEVVVRGSLRTVTVSGPEVRATLGLKSDWFTIRSPYAMSDVGGSVHRLAIEALVKAKIVSGCAIDRFCPDADVSREQMATLLDRALALPPTTVDAFDDDAGSVHQAAINRVAAAGIMAGTGARQFRPTAPVPRDQMATILTKAFRLPPSGVMPFTDVAPSNVHVASIRAVTAADVAKGCTQTLYCPDRRVSRAQTASLVARALGLV